MKLIRFTTEHSADAKFGAVIHERALSFSALQSGLGRSHPELADSRAYLAHLPDSAKLAMELSAWGEDHLDDLAAEDRLALDAVHLAEPVDVAALFDFGLTPQHLRNSAETMMKYEGNDPHTAPLLKAFAAAVLRKPEPSHTGRPEPLSYYKCNMNTIVGDGRTVPWPAYTSRLDIEPELAVVYGNTTQPVAGFCIFNDVSARDVQAPEFIGGFCLTKDMADGNLLGPYLVTPDELADPYDVDVTVTVNGHARFHGSTADIAHRAEDVFAWLETMAPIKSGSVMGFGTIPECTGLDHDDFLDPGDAVEITFDGLGTLHCRLGEPTGPLLPSRWPVRASLSRYHE